MTVMQPEGGAALLDIQDQVPERVSPMVELGATGLRRTVGYVDEEFLPQLRGRKAVQIYREMSDNDPIVGALVFAVDKLLRELNWRVEAASQSAEDKQAAQFLEECMDDMSHTWDDFISEMLSMLVYGWSWHEIVYKKRVGPWETDPRKRSKYTDGRLGWRKLPIRSQETLLRWVFDDTGGIKAMVQIAPPYYKTTVIPVEKSLLFRVTTAKGNPEGRSILRNAYRPWYMKKRLEEIEGIGVERDLAGLPVARVPHDYLTAAPGSDKAKMTEAFRKMVRGVRRDEQEGVVLPTAYDQDTKQPLFDFELLSAGGSRQFDTSAIIQRYEQRILMSVLADFILVGHEQTGSYALHTDKSGLFRTAINSIAESITDIINRHAVPRLFAVNGMKMDQLPKIVAGDVDPPDLTQLSQFMTSMANVGVQWFPDPELEKFLRYAARLPELDDNAEKLREQEYRQGNIMRLAQQHLQALQMQQEAESNAMNLEQQRHQVAQAAVQTEHAPVQAALQTEQQKLAIAQAAAQQPPDPREQQARDQESHALDMESKKQQLKQSDDKHKVQLEAMRQQQIKQSEDKHKVGLQALKTQGKQAEDKHKLELRLMMERAKQQQKAKEQQAKTQPKKDGKK